MNRLLLHFLSLLMLVASSGLPARADPPASTNVAATRCVIGLSPFLDNRVKDDVFRRIVGFVLEDLPLGSSLGLYDAYHLQTIAQIEIPKVAAFRSGKTRANQFKDQLNKLKRFLADPPERPASGDLKLDQAVRLPQFLDFVSERGTGTETPPVVVILGSPLYLDPKEPGFSMVDGYFPSDGHLLASRDRSVYGIKDRADALSGIPVHFAYFSNPTRRTPRYRCCASPGMSA
jgi:hypothetical protein